MNVSLSSQTGSGFPSARWQGPSLSSVRFAGPVFFSGIRLHLCKGGRRRTYRPAAFLLALAYGRIRMGKPGREAGVGPCSRNSRAFSDSAAIYFALACRETGRRGAERAFQDRTESRVEPFLSAFPFPFSAEAWRFPVFPGLAVRSPAKARVPRFAVSEVSRKIAKPANPADRASMRQSGLRRWQPISRNRPDRKKTACRPGIFRPAERRQGIRRFRPPVSGQGALACFSCRNGDGRIQKPEQRLVFPVEAVAQFPCCHLAFRLCAGSFQRSDHVFPTSGSVFFCGCPAGIANGFRQRGPCRRELHLEGQGALRTGTGGRCFPGFPGSGGGFFSGSPGTAGRCVSKQLRPLAVRRYVSRLQSPVCGYFSRFPYSVCGRFSRPLSGFSA